jgi:hypothetical protein
VDHDERRDDVREQQGVQWFRGRRSRAARRFYGEVVEQRIEMLDEGNGLMTMHLAGERPTAWFKDPAGNTLSVLKDD